MTARRNRMIALLCLAVLLAGCGKKIEAGAMGSEVWEEMPALTYGVMEYDKLEVLPWNSGRCEATSNYVMAETETGFYLLSNQLLYYADKANLRQWVPACSRAECTHCDILECDAYVSDNSFVIRDDRIYYVADSAMYPELYLGKGKGPVLLSMAPNGTDRQLAYVIEEVMDVSAGYSSAVLSAEHWLYSRAKLNDDGSYTGQIFRVTNEGEKRMFHEELEAETNAMILRAGSLYGTNGDPAYIISLLDSSYSKAYRIKEDQFEKINLSGLPTYGAYLSGNTLRAFRQNDGYYDIDLNTREEVRLADARMENSQSAIILPNCIVESTLLFAFSVENRTDGMTHGMELFNGETWRSVSLPDELVNAPKTVYMYIQTVTSQSVLLACRDAANDSSDISLYRIMLDSEELKLEYCGVVAQPTED